MIALAFGACGSATDSATVSSAGTNTVADKPIAQGASSASCAETVAGTFGEVAERVYRAAATGTNVEQAVHRVQGSDALSNAISRDDATAARAALQKLLVNQIVRIQLLRNGKAFASAGSGRAIAPVRGSIPGTDASFVLSVQSDHAYTQVTKQVTGAEVVLLRPGGNPSSTLATGSDLTRIPDDGKVDLGESFQVHSLKGQAFPSGPLRIALLVPSTSISCGAGPVAQARVATLGHVGERIYQEEKHSPYVLAMLRRVQRDPGFQRAVAAHDVAATRAAIVSFFAAHIHVVRVRVTVPTQGGGERLLIDLGGPYVLAPVHGVVRSDGKVVGHFTMAIQDDAGYLRLAQLFTGAEVLMRTGGRQVIGSLSPGPKTVPDRGQVSYRGRNYEAYSFTGEAFPSGPLRISLLIGA